LTSELYVIDIRAERALPVPAGLPGRAPLVRGVNDVGVIVGLGDAGYGRWTPNGDSYDYRSFEDLEIFDIDDAGNLVGVTRGGGRKPAIWRDGDPGPTLLPPVVLPGDQIFDEGVINDDGLILFNSQGTAVTGNWPVRWRPTDTGLVAELFPADNWRGARMKDLDNRGSAVGEATRTDGVSRSVRWDLA
jgi:hypothetical protein